MTIDWDNLEDFPNPNPYFPVPPRPVRRMGCLGSLMALAGGVVVWIIMGYTTEVVPLGLTFLLLILGCGFAVFSVLIANERFKSAPWIKGPVLPARIYVAPKGPPASMVWHAVGLIPILGILISAIAGWVSGPRNRVQLVWVQDGAVHDAVFQADRFWKRYRDNLDIWICVNKKGEVVPLENVAPSVFQNVEVPPEVARWLDSKLPSKYDELVEQRKQSILDDDARKAAKANTKAFKRASTYEKRPD